MYKTAHKDCMMIARSGEFLARGFPAIGWFLSLLLESRERWACVEALYNLRVYHCDDEEFGRRSYTALLSGALSATIGRNGKRPGAAGLVRRWVSC
jgi:hypothetical protein